MQSPQKQYTNEMHRRFGFFAVWTPSLPLALGDIGTFNGKKFIRFSSLKTKFGISPEPLLYDAPETLNFNSQGSVTVTTKIKGSRTLPGSALRDIDAGFIVEFSKTNSTLFKANGVLTHSINDRVTFDQQILDLFKQGKWDKQWAIITELMVADSATVLISNQSDSKIELKANANVDAVKLDIADASLDLSVVLTRSLETVIVAYKGLTPLFRTMKIKAPPLEKTGIKAVAVSKDEIPI